MKQTTTMQSLELTKTKLSVYIMMITLFTSGGDFLMRFLDKKKDFDYWRLLALCLIITFIVVIAKGISLILKKQRKIDFMQFEIENQKRMKKRTGQSI